MHRALRRRGCATCCLLASSAAHLHHSPPGALRASRRHARDVAIRRRDARTAAMLLQRHHHGNRHKKQPPDWSRRPTQSSRRRRMSVVLLGIDAMSRLTFERSMPRSRARLRATGWHELRGYNKIAKNTLPNLMAILTGLDEKQLTELGCFCPGNKTYDHCPFIWNNFKEAGYVTAYAEDCFMSSFLCCGASGFQRKPTDFYMRPLVVQVGECSLPHLKGKRDFCYGEQKAMGLLLNNLVELVDTFKERLFALYWLGAIGHDNEDLPATEDASILDLLRRLEETGALETTMFVFLSDHGNRLGDIRFTDAGWFEFRLPFIFVHFPPWFVAAYPEATFNFVAHGNLLTSPFDLHMTLKHVTQLDQPPLGGCAGCPLCRSLFSPGLEARTCDHAGVPGSWCTCWPRVDVVTWARNVKLAVATELRKRNQELSLIDDRQDQPGRCARLRLSHIARARRVQSGSPSTFAEYEVLFVAGPGNLTLETTVRHWLQATPPRFESLGSPNGLLYVEDVACDFVPAGDLRLLCYCLQEAV